jgi:hypothetical protein
MRKEDCVMELKTQENAWKRLIDEEIRKNALKQREIHELQKRFNRLLERARMNAALYKKNANEEHGQKMMALTQQCQKFISKLQTQHNNQFNINNTQYKKVVAQYKNAVALNNQLRAENKQLREMLHRNEAAAVLRSMGKKRQRTNLQNLRY